MMTDVNVTPTEDLYRQLQRLAEHFNRALFDAKLPPTMITLQRSAHTAGHFSGSCWRHTSGTSVGELALNPTYFASRPLLALCQTIVHELCHLWQNIDGNASRPGYHNTEWAKKMEEVGLMPSATGHPGGTKTGQKMADYPIAGGRFLQACQSLETAEFVLSWIDRGHQAPPTYRCAIDVNIEMGIEISERLLIPLEILFPEIDERTASPANFQKRKTKYQCPRCGMKVWGKQGMAIACRDCGEDFKESEDNVRG